MKDGRKAVGHAFLSYTREDSHRVDQLQRMLEASARAVRTQAADTRILPARSHVELAHLAMLAYATLTDR